MSRIFVPGFAALPSLYRPALPTGWTVHEPPSVRHGASLDAHLAAVRATLGASPTLATLAGHSMGAALAVLAALEQPDRVERLLLIAPAGLPLVKPMRASVRDFCVQVTGRVYPPGEAARALRAVLAAPRATLRLARAVRSLDLGEQLAEVRRRGIRCDVVGCVGDTLTPASHCRRVAELAGGRYHELDVPGGHVWMFVEPTALAAVLRD